MYSIIKIFVLIFIVLNSASAFEVDVEVNPKNPIVEESFDLVFNIEMSGSEAPIIRFDPGSAEVLGRTNRGESISTVVVNGRISTTRKVSIAYQLTPKSVGRLTIRDINVESGGETQKVKNIVLNVLKEAREPKGVFLRAETDKEEYFVGEGIDLKYYLYYRQYVVGQEIKEFPKLNGFIKRFHKNINNSETVQVDGVIYKRTLVYSARMYPEKIGEAVVDPMRISIQYSDMNSNSPFGTFGLQLGRYRSQTLSSKPIKLKIKAIPAENAPSNYTGLVGDHSFELTQSENKFLVNQAIEFRLSVEGEGALEKMDAPIIYQNPDLEQFDTRSELVELGESNARKQFDYTLLPRGQMNLAAGDFELSTFDPNSMSFITHKIQLPGLIVQGGGVAQQQSKPQSSPPIQTPSNVSIPTKVVAPIGFVAPEVKPLHFFSLVAYWPRGVFLLCLLAFIAVCVRVFWMLSEVLFPKSEIKKMLRELEINGPTYPALSHLLRKVYPDSSSTSSINELISQASELKEDERLFMKDWVQKAERYDYGKHDKKMKKADKSGSKKVIAIMNKMIKRHQDSLRI